MKGSIIHAVTMAALVVAQTVVFPAGLLRGAVPDLALIMLCLSANSYGTLHGQVSGFTSGIVLDALSSAPLGFHALIRTILGFLYGLFRDKLFIDPILVPVIMITVGTVTSAVLAFMLSAIFAPEVIGAIFTARLGVELGMNALIAPFAFALLKATGMVRTGRESARL